MGRRRTVPVRIIRPNEYQNWPPAGRPATPWPYYGAPGSQAATEKQPKPEEQALEPTKSAQDTASTVAELHAELEKWREKAAQLQAELEVQRGQLEQAHAQTGQLQAKPAEQRDQVKEAQARAEEWRGQVARLQADMENYRKRQQRLAQDQIDTERQRLLNAFLVVVDDLERALAAPAGDARALRQGVELTHRAALQFLQKEGVEPLQAEYQPFDPNWHEAVATVGHNGHGLAPNTIVQVVEAGYRLGDRLLRPAKVVVAT
jgi:molecular chaperone GrpE